MKELTNEEQIYDLIDVCDLCGEYVPVTNRNDGNDYLTLTGNQLLCQCCLN
jgi:hypothetical protein